MFATTERIRFDKIVASIPKQPGIYEIWTDSGKALKVGISINALKRLKDHAASRKSGLPQKSGDRDAPTPKDICSKKSILAKHLYFDQSLATEYNCDLRDETGRREFLAKHCYIVFEKTASKAIAREMEREREESGCFRYTGDVVPR